MNTNKIKNSIVKNTAKIEIILLIILLNNTKKDHEIMVLTVLYNTVQNTNKQYFGQYFEQYFIVF